MKIVVLVDAEVDPALLESREGPWNRWLDAHVIDALREMGHAVEVVPFAPDVDAALGAPPAEVAPAPIVLHVASVADRFMAEEGLVVEEDGAPAAGILQVLALPFAVAERSGRSALTVDSDFGSPRFFAHGATHTVGVLRRLAPDVVFNLTRHAFGLRAWAFYVPLLLEALDIPYTGSGPVSEAVSINKAKFKAVLREHGLPVPDFAVFPRAPSTAPFAVDGPALIKPLWGGGSEALSEASLVEAGADVETAALAISRALHMPVVAERFIEGREISIAVAETSAGLNVFPPGEWHFGTAPERFVTRRVKWDLAYCDEVGITFGEAALTAAEQERIEHIARRAFEVLDFRGYGNFDLRLDAAGDPYIVDANARPGLFPGSGRWRTMPFATLLEHILQAALRPTADAGGPNPALE